MARPPRNDLPLMSADDGVVLFHPRVPRKARQYVSETLDGRWVGLGPRFELFEAASVRRPHWRIAACRWAQAPTRCI